MILDTFSQRRRYEPLNPRFGRAFAFLEGVTPDTAVGRHEIDGDAAYALVQRYESRGRAGSKLEAHRRYIDIQVAVAGADEIGLKPVADCRDVELDYDEGHDCSLFRDRPENWIALPAGSFVVFFPDDGHAPLATASPVRKAVVKVLIDG